MILDKSGFVPNEAQRKKKPVDSVLVPGNPAEHPSLSIDLIWFDAFGEDLHSLL